MTDILPVLNRRDPATDAQMSIQLDKIQQAGMRNVWCINFRNMQIEECQLIGVDSNGDNYIAIKAAYAEEKAAWVVPTENIYEDKHSAEKGLFTAHLKYERD